MITVQVEEQGWRLQPIYFPQSSLTASIAVNENLRPSIIAIWYIMNPIAVGTTSQCLLIHVNIVCF